MSFNQLGLAKKLLEHLDHLGFTEVYPIQRKAIPAILRNDDVLGIAPTGSGKTASYALPILTQLQKARPAKNRQVPVLVMVPTRELAEQVKLVFHSLSKDLPTPVKTLAVYGGVSINPQMKELQNVSVLVATPGRLIELASTNALSLEGVKTLVLDEADKMLNLGFEKEMEAVFKQLPHSRQNLLFSATLSPQLETMNKMVLRAPKVIEITREENDIDKIDQKAYFIKTEEKGPLLRKLIKDRNEQVLVFASSVYQCENILDKLNKNGIDARAIHSKRSQNSRTEALKDFKSGRVQVLIATDLLARGVDIAKLPLVINYDLPRSPKDYIHRIGRTGRAESNGTAISLIAPEEEHHFRVIQKKMGKWVNRVEL